MMRKIWLSVLSFFVLVVVILLLPRLKNSRTGDEERKEPVSEIVDDQVDRDLHDGEPTGI
jgi:hypothetical protein